MTQNCTTETEDGDTAIPIDFPKLCFFCDELSATGYSLHTKNAMVLFGVCEYRSALYDLFDPSESAAR